MRIQKKTNENIKENYKIHMKIPNSNENTQLNFKKELIKHLRFKRVQETAEEEMIEILRTDQIGISAFPDISVL